MESSKSQAHSLGYKTGSLKSLGSEPRSDPRINKVMIWHFESSIEGEDI